VEEIVPGDVPDAEITYQRLDELMPAVLFILCPLSLEAHPAIAHQPTQHVIAQLRQTHVAQ
jgi:hypothetical protein